jgi:hypothetical protein
MSRRIKGRSACTPRRKNLSCWRTISLATLRIVVALVQRLDSASSPIAAGRSGYSRSALLRRELLMRAK